MNFDFLNFFALVGLSGGVLSLIDFAWLAYSGSNIDYSLKILGMVIAVDFVCPVLSVRTGRRRANSTQERLLLAV